MLGLVGVKLLIEDLVEIGPIVGLMVIAVAFTIGILLSIRADRRGPRADEKREERIEQMKQGGGDASTTKTAATATRTASRQASCRVRQPSRPAKPSRPAPATTSIGHQARAGQRGPRRRAATAG